MRHDGPKRARSWKRRIQAKESLKRIGSPLLGVSEGLWSIRAVVAMEPFVSVEIEPAQEFTWMSTYEYYKLSDKK